MKLIIIIPALNEEATIARVLGAVPHQIQGIDRIEKIVIDDGSTDHTAELARQNGAAVVSHPLNRGVGAAFATGVQAALAAGADVIVNMDGDGQFDPAGIPALIAPILEKTADFATCSRFLDPKLHPKMSAIKFWGNQGMSALISLLTRKKFTDVSCGFRAYSRETALRLNLFGDFTYTQESFLDLAQKGIRMAEVPLPVRGEREFGTSRVAGSVGRYALRAGTIIIQALRDSKPLTFFGSIGVGVLALGLAAGIFIFIWWLLTGQTTPYQAMISLSTLLTILGFLLIVLALIADMLGRIKRNQEDLLYLLKKQAADRNHADGQP